MKLKMFNKLGENMITRVLYIKVKFKRKKKILLQGPQMLVDKTNFGLVLYNHANFYWFEETSSCWSFKGLSVFLCFSLVNQQHISGITEYNRTVTNIENTVQAVHSCNSWLALSVASLHVSCFYYLKIKTNISDKSLKV